jgi:hypothetical protein
MRLVPVEFFLRHLMVFLTLVCGEPSAAVARGNQYEDCVQPGLPPALDKYGLERVKGIEPSSSAWKAVALPLSYTRIITSALLQLETFFGKGPT